MKINIASIFLKLPFEIVSCACLDTSGVASLRHNMHTPRKSKKATENERQDGVGFAAEPLGNGPLFSVFCFFRYCLLMGFSHSLYYFAADLSYVFALVLSAEVVKK